LLIALTFLAFGGAVVLTRVLLIFWGMVIAVIGIIAWRIWICVDAFLVARRKLRSEGSSFKVGPAFWVSGLLIVLCSLCTSTDTFMDSFGYFRAFKISSSSFCPTICKGERVVADMDAYVKAGPKQGDVTTVMTAESKGSAL
jgi:hypothetical protein